MFEFIRLFPNWIISVRLQNFEIFNHIYQMSSGLFKNNVTHKLFRFQTKYIL